MKLELRKMSDVCPCQIFETKHLTLSWPVSKYVPIAADETKFDAVILRQVFKDFKDLFVIPTALVESVHEETDSHVYVNLDLENWHSSEVIKGVFSCTRVSKRLFDTIESTSFRHFRSRSFSNDRKRPSNDLSIGLQATQKNWLALKSSSCPDHACKSCSVLDAQQRHWCPMSVLCILRSFALIYDRSAMTSSTPHVLLKRTLNGAIMLTTPAVSFPPRSIKMWKRGSSILKQEHRREFKSYSMPIPMVENGDS